MDEFKSKSQKKREAHALQDFGEMLVALSMDKLDKLPLSDQLRRAILEAKTLKSYGAIKRQIMYIGKLLRPSGADEAEDKDNPLLLAYQQLEAEESSQTAEFHLIEQWRERLLCGGNEALTAYVDAYPSVDVQHLRQLIKKAVSDHEKKKNSGASRALFRYLRSVDSRDEA